MGWPKGKRRKPPSIHELDKPMPPEMAASECESNLDDLVDESWSRSDSIRAHEKALFEFVESGEHIETDEYYPGTKQRAEKQYQALDQRNQMLKAGTASTNTERAEKAEARRQWIATHCEKAVFDDSRKRGAADIQESLRAAGWAAPSDSRVYADIAAIRTAWGRQYYSRAKDKP